MDKITDWKNRICDDLESCLFINDENKELIILSLLSFGHTLLTGNSSTGKSSIAKKIATTSGLHYKRVFCNSNLEPMDLRGTSIYSESKKRVLYKKGIIQTNILILEDINRLNNRTQSSLIEIMNSKSISVDGKKIELPEPFIIIGTLNNSENEGVFPLSKRFIDSFLLSIDLSYPDEYVEKRFILNNKKESSNSLSNCTEIEDLYQKIDRVNCSNSVINYIIDITEQLNSNENLSSLITIKFCDDIIKIAKRVAALNERDYILPKDVIYLLKPMLNHKIHIKENYSLRNLNLESILNDIISSITIPEERRI